MKRNITYLLYFAIVLLCVQNAVAQDARNRFNPETYGATSLSIAPDARSGAMGEMGVATDADCNSQFYNAAKYPFNIARAGVAFSYTPWLRKIVSGINLANVQGFYRIGDYSAVSASFRYFSIGETTIAGSDMTVNPYEFSLDVAYSRMLSRCTSMAVTMRFIYSDIFNSYSDGTSPAKAFGADIALYRCGYLMMGSRECQFSWGLTIANIGTKINYGGTDSRSSLFQPTSLRLGANYLIPLNDFNKISFGVEAYKLLIPTFPIKGADESDQDYENRCDEEFYNLSPIKAIFTSFADAPGGFSEEMQEIRWKFGLEYTYNDRFMLRCGYMYENPNKGNRSCFTAGAGFHMSVFTIDAAYMFAMNQLNPLDQTMRFTLGFDLDGFKDLFGRGRR